MWAAELVTVDVVDISGGKEGIYLAKMGMCETWRNLLIIRTACVMTRFVTFKPITLIIENTNHTEMTKIAR